ncbi:MAG: stage V sporulation protein AE [Bacilli bacterium]|nr:stage V sporulation protein AE [Bacilli bacterium]
MSYILSMLVCGGICIVGQLLYDNTKLTPGHITSLFVVTGALLDSFGIYDVLLKVSKVGASLPITSFGHSLMHAGMESVSEKGVLGIAAGLFNMTSIGITSAILFAFLIAIIFKPKS